MFGSLATGLGTPSSEIDISVDLQPNKSEPLPPSESKLREFILSQSLPSLRRMFWLDQGLKGLEVVTAYHPLVKMRHADSGLDIQWVMAKEPSASKLVIEYLEEYPQLKAIFMVMKSALEARGLMERYSGGLGSYPLLSMIVAFLKISPNSSGFSLGATLHEFLDFYADFDTFTNGITVEPPGIFEKQCAPSSKDRHLKMHNEMVDSDDIEVSGSCLSCFIV